METPASATYQFAAFEVNAASGELLKDGVRIKLQEQPFRLLVILLENAGQIVTREQIQRRIWPGNTFVDFDGSLRVAVRKLRDALGDDADKPQFIETIPKRGYRLLVPAIRNRALAAQIAVPEPVSPASSQEANPQALKRWGFMIVLLVCGAVGSYLFFFRHSTILTEKDTLLLADFSNSTGDAVFEGTLRQGMAVQLEQSPFLSLVSEERIRQTLQMMGKPADTRLTPDIAPEICERTGSVAVLDGSITSFGTQYVLGLRAKHCRTGEILAQEQGQASRKEDVLKALDQIASRFRRRVGESISTVEKYDRPLAEATTPSLEALRAYSVGLRVLFASGSDAAIPFLQHAAEMDPQFAMAYAWLGRAHGDMGEFGLSREETSKAFTLRDRASEPEKFFISASYDLQVSGDVEKAKLTCVLWIQAYPRAMIPHAFLAGIVYPVTGRPEEAIQESKRVIELDPDFAIGYSILAFSYQYLDDLTGANSALQRASDRKLELPDFLIQRYDVAFLRGNQAEMEKAVSLAQRGPESETWIADHEAFVLAYSGHLSQARTVADRAVRAALKAGERERAAQFEAGAALWAAFFGNSPGARRGAEEALQLSKDRDVEYGAGLALAIAGHYSHAQTLTRDLEQRFPDDTDVKFNYVPTLRAVLALNHGDAAQAIELLRMTVPYELGATRSSLHAFFGALYPVYVRGMAYIAEHKGAEAAFEFQKIIDHRGVVVSDPIGALAHWQLGRAYGLAGDMSRAKSAYQDFLALWTNADADIPVFQSAKREHANLQ